MSRTPTRRPRCRRSAWIDRAGRTFRYTAHGPESLAGGKTVIVVSTRGGRDAGIPAMAAMEYQESYILAVFAFLGITDVRIVCAEGLAISADARAKAMAQADAAITGFTAEAASHPQAVPLLCQCERYKSLVTRTRPWLLG